MTSDAESVSPSPEDLLHGYPASGAAYDELVALDGSVRPHWRRLLQSLGDLPSRERLSRVRRLDRQVRDTGLAHHIFADPNAAVQPWRVNLMPLVISAGEWRWLETALKQRARLLEVMLRDIYGSQQLMRSGRIPPELVFADPAYLRSCQSIAPPHGHLQFYAVDLARGPDGSWRVIDNHAETPAGVGYAVANRIMLADVAADSLVDCNIRRLSSHFQALQADLAQRAGAAESSTAIITPGPDHDDYFSHAYLARYLGVHLVEGGDLRVVGDKVYLKTLEGLKPIDLVVRCIEGAKADPLELDPNYFHAPSGLVQAVRATPSLCANALGSAIVENRGLSAYLPGLCQELLGEPLMLADTPRWWLGDPAARRHVAARIDHMVISPAREGTGRPGRASPGRSSQTMTAADRAALLADIERRGPDLVAQERIGFGTMPSLSAQGLQPHPFAVRLFVSAGGGEPYVMPGGLAMTVDPQTAVTLNAADGETHDVWVVGAEPEKPHQSLWRPHVETARIQRSQRTLQSRVADNLFWLGRYLERADWTLRVMRGAIGRRLEYLGLAPVDGAGQRTLAHLAEKGRPARAAGPDGRRPIALARALSTQPDGSYSLSSTYDGVHRVASLTRDRLSLEAWRTLATLRVDDDWRRRMADAGPSEMQDEIEDKLTILATFSGHMHENMTRNVGWRFLDMGRRLERAHNICDTLALLFAMDRPEDAESDALRFVLEVADSYITYRSRYRLEPMLALVLDLLLIDETNPRSLAYQLASLTAHLETLPQASEGSTRTRERRIVLALQTAVRLADVDALVLTGSDGRRVELVSLMGHATRDLPLLSDAISRRYFRLSDDEPRRVAPRFEHNR